MRKAILPAAAILVAAAVSYGAWRGDAMLRIASGYKAKVACSEIFLAGRDEGVVVEGEFDDISPFIDRASLKIDEAQRAVVSAGLFGLGRARAVYRDGYGCTLESGGAPSPRPALAPIEDKALPEALSAGDASRVDYAALATALKAAIADENAGHRGLLVVVDGAIVGEAYAEGFSGSTRFLSWSMAKSVTASLVGAAVEAGYVEIDKPAPVPEWRGDAARGAIAWRDLLQMQSGLAFDETYGDPDADVSRMLFASRDAGAVAAKSRLDHDPGTHFYYSSGTTNLIARTLRQDLERRGLDIYAFARERLFAPLGMASVVMEPDASGTPIGSSYIYATTRDWAKLGLLYLNDGVADGTRLLPENWSDFVSAPAGASDNFYGGQFWLNREGPSGRGRYVPGLPEDVYLMAGHEGQYVAIVPDKRMVIVRTGMTRGREAMPVVAPTLAAIYAAVAP